MGGGRKRLVDLDPGLRPALLALVEPDERGDPMSPLRCTTKSTRRLADELTRQGHRISADTVADLLRGAGFSLQGNAKMIEGKQHPDRDAQFSYLNEQVKDHQATGDPVVSVDAKKTGPPLRHRAHRRPDPQGRGRAARPRRRPPVTAWLRLHPAPAASGRCSRGHRGPAGGKSVVAPCRLPAGWPA